MTTATHKSRSPFSAMSQESKKAAIQTVLRIGEEIRRPQEDARAFEIFYQHQTAMYFEAQASQNPEQAQEHQRYATIFNQAASARMEIRTASADRFDALRETLDTAQNTAKAFDIATKRAVNDFAFQPHRLDKFIAADPKRWERLRQEQPKLVRRTQPTSSNS